MTLRLDNYEVYNISAEDNNGYECIAVKVLKGEDAGVIVTFNHKTIAQMIDFLYNACWDDKPTKN